MTYLSLFSGIEAATAAWGPLGWNAAAFAEVDKACCRLLAAKYPSVPNLGDVTKISKSRVHELGHIDIVIFGSPCQDLSIAGKRGGLKGERSGLFFDAMRIVRWSGARFALWENVPGAFSSNEGRDFAAVVGEMAGSPVDTPEAGWRNTGVVIGDAGLVEWSVLDAQWFGVPQRRRRIFPLADFGDWANRPPILLEPESMFGNPPTRGEAREDITPPVGARLGDGGYGHDFDLNGGLVGHALNAEGGSGRSDFESETFVAHSLRAEGFDASEDGTGRGIPLTVSTLTSNGDAHSGLRGTAGLIPFDTTQITSKANVSNPKAGDPCHPLAAGAHAPAIAFNLRGREDGAQAEISDMASLRAASGGSSRSYVAIGLDEEQNASVDSFGCLKARKEGGGFEGSVMTGSAVRRLTPRECERLQGFEDGYTFTDGKADGPRYKALGNSMAVPVIRWIGRRVMEATTCGG